MKFSARAPADTVQITRIAVREARMPSKIAAGLIACNLIGRSLLEVTDQRGKGIDRGAAPPSFVGAYFEDREVQVRSVGRRISRCAHIPDHMASLDESALMQIRRIVIEVSIVVAIGLFGIE